MRSFTTSLLGLAVALPLGFATVPARADNDNLLGRAQGFFQNWGDNDQNSYQRGRQDEWQRDHARRDWDNRYNQAQRDEWRGDRHWDRDRADNDGWRWRREHDQQFGYNNRRDDGDYRGDWNR